MDKTFRTRKRHPLGWLLPFGVASLAFALTAIVGAKPASVVLAEGEEESGGETADPSLVQGNQLSEISDAIAGKGYADSDTDVGSGLVVNLTSSTTTPAVQSYNVTFSSSISTVTNSAGNVHVSIDDPTYVPDVPIDENDVDENGELIYPTYTGQVYQITDKGIMDSEVYIPTTLQRNGYYILNIIGILPNAVNTEAGGSIKALYVPESVLQMPENALAGLNENCQIYLQHAEKPETFEDGWTNVPEANIHWGSDWEYPKNFRPFVLTGATFGNGLDYVLGYDRGNQSAYTAKRLIVTYDLLNSDGSKATYHRELPLTINLANTYRNGVGDRFGSFTYTRTIDIPLEAGQSVDDESIYISNIYLAGTSNDGKIAPDEEVEYYAHANVAFSQKYDLSDFASFTYKATATFGGYSNFTISTTVNNEIFPIINPSSYAANGHTIEQGTGHIRFRLTSLNNYVYRFTYEGENGEIKEASAKISSPLQYFEVGNNSTIAFLIKNKDIAPDFSTDKMRSFVIESMMITVDMMNDNTHQAFGHSAVNTRFGLIEMTSDNFVNDTSNLNWTMILVVIIYTTIMAAASAGLYIYKTQKFKNDEFRRVKPKSFWYNAGLAYVLFGFILLFIVSCVFRWGAFNNAIVVFNPVDPLVIVFGVLAILSFGYYVRWLVVTIKNEKERRKAIKLKLDSDINDDDGTK